MTVPKINDESALSINIKWLLQIVALVGTAVYMYLGLENRIKEAEDEVKVLDTIKTLMCFLTLEF